MADNWTKLAANWTTDRGVAGSPGRQSSSPLFASADASITYVRLATTYPPLRFGSLYCASDVTTWRRAISRTVVSRRLEIELTDSRLFGVRSSLEQRRRSRARWTSSLHVDNIFLRVSNIKSNTTRRSSRMI